MHPPVGVVDLLAAFDGASVRASVAGFICVAALAVLQVVVFVGSPDVRSGVRWRDALSISGQIVMLYAVFDSLGFPLITTAALVGTHTVTRTVMAPAVLAVGVCFFLWL
jgi:hypothetical protein